MAYVQFWLQFWLQLIVQNGSLSGKFKGTVLHITWIWGAPKIADSLICLNDVLHTWDHFYRYSEFSFVQFLLIMNNTSDVGKFLILHAWFIVLAFPPLDVCHYSGILQDRAERGREFPDRLPSCLWPTRHRLTTWYLNWHNLCFGQGGLGVGGGGYRGDECLSHII